MDGKRVAVLLLTGTLAAAITCCASAQAPNGGGRRGGFGRGGFGRGGFGGGQNGFGGRGMFGQRGGAQMDRNPLTSHAMQLLQRPEVQNELHLDLKQKQALEQTQTQAQADMRQQMQQTFQQMRQNRGQGGNDPNASPESRRAQRQQQRQQMQEQVQSQMRTFQTQLDAKVNSILRPDQIKRLHELDLQWRGVLSIGDPKVAQELQVGNEHQTALAGMANEYLTAQRDARRQAFQGFRPGRRGNNQNGAQPAQPQQPPTQEQIQSQLLALQRADEAARKASEEKALTLLTPEEKAHWTAAIGEPFVFRTDNPAGGA